MRVAKVHNRTEGITRRGHTFIFEIEVENTGDQKFEKGHNLEVSDTIPTHFTIRRITSGGKTDPDNKQRVIWGGIELEPGQKKTFEIEVRVNDDAPLAEICNTATVSFEEGVRDQDTKCITVKEAPKVAATIAPTPKLVTPVGVPITAPTGAPAAAALATSLFGTGSLAFFLRKFW
ncbi:MAG: hypothetical protein AAB538_04420 [Patescibacteria group bacterium]